jgi:ATP-dependent Clp protease adaptor protein ClpS
LKNNNKDFDQQILQPIVLSNKLVFANAGNHAGNHDDDRDGQRGTGTITKPKIKTKKPSMYKVLLLNDDYTPMDFVVYVLQKYFRLSIEDATEVMLQVHTKGVGVCGVFTFEVAETKVTHVLDLAKKYEHPLQCTLEEA